MKRTAPALSIVIVALAALLVSAPGCTLKNQEAPPLSGPSEFGTSITLTASPDAINQDGGSQSLITITARDSNGNPLRNVSLRTDIFVGGVHTDFGTLSARSVVTDANGRATLIYTAPASPAGPSVDANTTVDIVATPLGTDFANAVSRLVTIRLLPIGIVVPPDGLQPDFTFTPTSPTDHQDVLFTACGDPTKPCAPANNPVASYSWDFGDGRTATGRTATHSYNESGTYFVTLTISDSVGRSAAATRQITVIAGALPTARFSFSPTSPQPNQQVNFNASASTATQGHRIVSYSWDFGDGQPGVVSTSPLTSHTYTQEGDYVVLLIVTDDLGKTGVSTATTVPVKLPETLRAK
jgi:chitodextrinase